MHGTMIYVESVVTQIYLLVYDDSTQQIISVAANSSENSTMP